MMYVSHDSIMKLLPVRRKLIPIVIPINKEKLENSRISFLKVLDLRRVLGSNKRMI